jgi:hypothetical protein
VRRQSRDESVRHNRITGEKNGAMQQYYILQTLNPKLAADLLKSIPK